MNRFRNWKGYAVGIGIVVVCTLIGFFTPRLFIDASDNKLVEARALISVGGGLIGFVVGVLVLNQIARRQW